MRSSRVTSKYQATIPKDIRESLKLKAGDTVIFQIAPNGTVTLSKAEPSDEGYLRALSSSLSEWDSPEDEEDYEHLQDI